VNVTWRREAGDVAGAVRAASGLEQAFTPVVEREELLVLEPLDDPESAHQVT
jgi:hypothetical protein